MNILIVRTFPNILDPKQYNIQELGLAKALTKRGCHCGIVLYNGRNGDCTEKVPVTWEGKTENIIVYRLHGYNFLKNGIFPSIGKIARNYDVIQVHEYDQITSWFYYAWRKQPVVVYHGPYYNPFNKGYNLKCRIFDATFLKLKSNRKVNCITKSTSAATFLKQKGFCNVVSVGVGLDVDNLRKSQSIEDSDISVESGKFTLLYVGKIEERRNPYFFLDIMNELRNRHLDIQLIIVGDGEKEYVNKFLTAASILRNDAYISYYPSVSQEKIGQLYQKVQLMIFPTHYDIFGMVLLEALYYGLPVISSKNGGCDMLIADRENGLILENFNSTEWADSIQNLMQNELQYNKMKMNIESEDKFRLTWDAIAPKFLYEYENAARR